MRYALALVLLLGLFNTARAAEVQICLLKCPSECVLQVGPGRMCSCNCQMSVIDEALLDEVSQEMELEEVRQSTPDNALGAVPTFAAKPLRDSEGSINENVRRQERELIREQERERLFNKPLFERVREKLQDRMGR